jgi:hypothetical protein
VFSGVIKSASPLSAALCTPRAPHEVGIQTVNQIADPQGPVLFQPVAVPGSQKSGFRLLAQTAAGQLKIDFLPPARCTFMLLFDLRGSCLESQYGTTVTASNMEKPAFVLTARRSW